MIRRFTISLWIFSAIREMLITLQNDKVDTDMAFHARAAYHHFTLLKGDDDTKLEDFKRKAEKEFDALKATDGVSIIYKKINQI